MKNLKLATLLSLSLVPTWHAFALTETELTALIKEVDDKQRNTGDYKTLAYIEQKDKDKNPQVFEATVYRRDSDDKWMLIFSKPKADAGKGYLRVDKNLFLYEPSVGKWERRTEKSSIGGTGSQRQDFDESRLADEYAATFVADEKLGKFEVHHVKLTVKPNQDVASPILHLWIDKATHNILKRQEMALSEKLLRTLYYPTWEKIFSKSKNAEVYVPREMRIFDEVEKGNSTIIKLLEISLDPLDANIFTKAFVEARSR